MRVINRETAPLKVKDIFKVLGGGTPSTAIPEYWTGPIPWITSADLDEDLSITARKTISRKAISASATNLVPAGSVVVATRVGLGKVGIADTGLCFSQDCQGLVAEPKACDPKFAAHQLKQSVQVFKHISRGTTISGVTKKQLLELPFWLPPIKEQKNIVAELESHFSRLDEGVESLKRVQENLKRFRASVLKAACEGRLVPTEAELARKEKRSYETGAQLLERILKERRTAWEKKKVKEGRNKKYVEPAPPDTSNLPDLPEGWAWASAEQLCYFITKGTTPASKKIKYGKGEVPFIKVYNLTFSGYLNISHKPAYVDKITHDGELSRSKVICKDVLINIVGPPLGQVSIVPDDMVEANINQAIARFRAIKPFYYKYLAYMLMAEPVIKWALRKAKTTAGQANLTLELCRALPIPLPPLREQNNIVIMIERIFRISDELDSIIALNFQEAGAMKRSMLSEVFQMF